MPVVQVFSWTGFYIGGNAGWGWTNRSGTFTTALGADPFTVSNNGFLGGAQLGYNWQTGPFVLGAEADFQGTAASGSLNASAGPTISATAQDAVVRHGSGPRRLCHGSHLALRDCRRGLR